MMFVLLDATDAIVRSAGEAAEAFYGVADQVFAEHEIQKGTAVLRHAGGRRNPTPPPDTPIPAWPMIGLLLLTLYLFKDKFVKLLIHR